MTRAGARLDEAANALWCCQWKEREAPAGQRWEDLTEQQREHQRNKVRAVAKVILSAPASKKMIEAWHDAYPPPGKHMDDDYPIADWKAMAVALLAELEATK